MNNLVLDEIEQGEFFAPSNFDAIDGLLGNYKLQLKAIERVYEFMSSDGMHSASWYFFKGTSDERDGYTPNLGRIFQLEAAINALNSEYWQKALNLTDVMEFMPDKRRQEWNKQIQGMTTPDFEEVTVRATLKALLNQRMDFLAEMTDGIFRGLSGEHVTNRPEGFSKRMIINNIYDVFGYTSSWNKSGLIHDLRCVIAKFMGRDTPTQGATRSDLEYFRKETGKWYTWDGGALRICVYLKGTAHLEVHPQMAYRLNQVLAHLYPSAIPHQYKTRPKKTKIKDFDLFSRPIPFKVLSYIKNARFYRNSPHYLPNTLAFGYYGNDLSKADKHIKREVAKILEYIGGVWTDTKINEHLSGFIFDYNAEEVIEEICSSGMLPDYRSYQYYPTPSNLAQYVVAKAEIKSGHECLEPQAGQGGLAQLMPFDSTTCVEISKLHATVLQAKGYNVITADFLEWCKSARTYDRIVMNPPFSEGRAKAHLNAASNLLASDGRLVAILPASYRGDELVPGRQHEWSEIFKDEFYNAAVDVAVLTLT